MLLGLLRSPKAPERAPALWRSLQRGAHRRRGTEAAPHFGFMAMGGSSRIAVAAQGQQAKLVRAIEQFFVGQFTGLSHAAILHRVRLAGQCRLSRSCFFINRRGGACEAPGYGKLR